MRPAIPLPTGGSRARRNASLPAATALACGLLAALPAAAQPVAGLYVGLGAGANWTADTDLTLSSTLVTALRNNGRAAPGGEASYDAGYVLAASLGYGFGNGLRTEIEASYRRNDIDAITGFGQLGASGKLNGANGNQTTFAGMVNLLYDFHGTMLPTWVVPYLGVGIGIAGTGLNSATVRSAPLDITVKPDGGGITFAYQLIAGAAFPIDAAPGLAITTELRYFGTLQNEYDTTTSVTSTGRQIGSGTLEADNRNLSLMVGLRYNFGVTPPPPPAPVPVAAAPAPVRSFLVFFDFDRAVLTDRARQIVAEAAQASTRQQTTRIEVAGHADRSGPAQHNQRLSQRRADAVAAELVRLGVSRNAISVQAFGESRPLVPTADGVREPQNRRVEIVLQ